MRALKAATAGLLIGSIGRAASAHHIDARVADVPGWTFDPLTVALLTVSIGLFGVGWSRLRARSGHGAHGLRRRALFFVAGWASLALAVVSPLHEAGERSFTAHMAEHELIMLLGAPLLVLAEPLVVMLWAFPSAARRAIGQAVTGRVVATVWQQLTSPVTATFLQAAALWIWHAPMLFDLALASEGWHIGQHLSFLTSALLFWSAMLGRRGGQSTASSARAAAALCLFVTSIVSGALGALMAFSQSPWYAGYARLGLAPFGLTPAEDQQLAGLIMWIPGGLVHAIAALLVLRTVLKPRVADGALSNAL